MRHEGIKGEISNQNLCSTSQENKDDKIEEGLIFSFKSKDDFKLVDFDAELFKRLFSAGFGKSLVMGNGCSILKGIYNIDVGDFQFKGQKFSSAQIGPNVIKLHITIPYKEDFHTFISKNFRKVINFSFVEVNEQKEVPQPEE